MNDAVVLGRLPVYQGLLLQLLPGRPGNICLDSASDWGCCGLLLDCCLTDLHQVVGVTSS
jgi:hypothetical protein